MMNSPFCKKKKIALWWVWFCFQMAARSVGYVTTDHEEDAGGMYRRNRPVSGVSFHQRLSVYSATGTEIELFDLNG